MSKDSKIDPFNTPLLDDKETASEEHSYIVPNIETKLSKRKRDECREIVREIKEFGVNQRQLLYVIYLLSLELENTDAMRALSKVIGEVREQIPVAELHIEGSLEKKIETGDADKDQRTTTVPPNRKKLIL